MKKLIYLTFFFPLFLFSQCEDLTQKRDADVFCHLDEDLMSLEQIVKNISMNSAQTNDKRNQLVLQIMDKAHYSDDIASILSGYFLQERISSKDPDLNKKLKLVHQMLVLSYQIKHAVDMQMVLQLKKNLVTLRSMFLSDEDLKEMPKTSRAKYRSSYPRQL